MLLSKEVNMAAGGWSHLCEGVGEPVVQGVGVGQQVCGPICQALCPSDGQHNRPARPVQAYDVRHIPCHQQALHSGHAPVQPLTTLPLRQPVSGHEVLNCMQASPNSVLTRKCSNTRFMMCRHLICIAAMCRYLIAHVRSRQHAQQVHQHA